MRSLEAMEAQLDLVTTIRADPPLLIILLAQSGPPTRQQQNLTLLVGYTMQSKYHQISPTD